MPLWQDQIANDEDVRHGPLQGRAVLRVNYTDGGWDDFPLPLSEYQMRRLAAQLITEDKPL